MVFDIFDVLIAFFGGGLVAEVLRNIADGKYKGILFDVILILCGFYIVFGR